MEDAADERWSGDCTCCAPEAFPVLFGETPATVIVPGACYPPGVAAGPRTVVSTGAEISCKRLLSDEKRSLVVSNILQGIPEVASGPLGTVRT